MFWIITALSIVGVILNVYKSRWGFFCWMITNAVWAVVDYQKGIPEQAVLFIVYFLTSLWGWVSWSKQGKQKGEYHAYQKLNE